jgi:hypothetical protein
MKTQTIFGETVCLKKLKWKAVFDVSILYTDIMVNAPGLRGANKQEKPVSLMGYDECKIWVS